MYIALGICLIFALLLALNVFASLAASVLWRVVSPIVKHFSAARRAQIIFALRFFPLLSAIVLVFAFLLPSYLLFEPHSSNEVVTFKLGLLALLSAAGIVAAFYRVFGTYRATRRLIVNWLADAEQIEIETVSIPVYRIEHKFPVIAVVGVFRPRIFIANQIFASLDADEIAAAIRHEHGHLAARDNLKRTILRVCRDLLVFPFGRRLDRVWADIAESAADEYAAQTGGNQTAVNLAAALVKIARIVPRGAKPAMPAGAFLIEEQTADVSLRVRQLLELTERRFSPAARRFLGAAIPFWIYLAGFAAIVFTLATNRDFLERVHFALENIVSILQ
ncbi:MAG: M56 family metallopeptidase [Pyrinomonadaceae bacterium]